MPDKITYQDFAKRIKEKYPQYIDLDDSTLTSKIIAKYPQYKETVDFEIPENAGLINKKEELKTEDNKDIAVPFAMNAGLAATEAENPTMFLFDANSLKKRLEAIPKYFPRLTDQSEELKKQLLNINSQNIDDLKHSVTDLEKQVMQLKPASMMLGQQMAGDPNWSKYENEVLKDKHILAGQRLMEDTERLKELAEIPLTREQEGFWDKTKAAIKGLDVGKYQGAKDYVTEYNKLMDDFKAYPEINRIYEKIKKLNNNEDVDFTTDERLLMQLAIDNAQVHEKLDDKISTYYKIGEGLGKSIGFQLEFLLTSSVGGKPAGAIAKTAMKAGMKKVPKYSLLALSKLTQAGIQTTTMPSFYKLAAQNASHGMSFGEAVLNAYWEMGAETLSERIFMKPAGSIANLNSFNKFLARTGINIRTDKGALGVILPMIEETAEEKISEILTAPKNYKDFGEFWKGFTDLEDNAVMLGSVSLMVGGMGSASVLGNSYLEGKRKGRLARYEKFVPTDLRAEIDAVLEIEDLSVKDQYDLIADAISDRIETGDLGEDPATTAGNAMAYMNYRIQDMAAETVNKKGQVEGNRLVVGKTEEGDTEAQQAQLDYLKQRGVEVPEGTKMDELGKLYDTEVAKETAEVEIDEAETPEQIEEIKGKIEEDVDLLKKLDAKKEFITEKEKLDESLDKEEISETEYENKLEKITNTYESEIAEKIEPVKPEVEVKETEAELPKIGEEDFVTENAVMEGIYSNEAEIDGEKVALPEAGFLISDVYLKEGTEKGKGFGQRLYRDALKRYGVLYSTPPISDDALRVQNTLRDKGEITITSATVGNVDFRVLKPIKKETVKPETEKKLAEKKTEISEIQQPETEQVEEKLPKKETVKEKVEEKLPETVTPKYEKLTTNLGIKGKTLTKSLGKSARNGKIGGVSVIMQQGAKENEVILESIKTPKYQRGTGKATNAMNKIIAEADKQGLTIKLRAVPEKGADISQENLIKFYENFGFEFKEGSIEGVRTPKKKGVQDAEKIGTPTQEAGKQTQELEPREEGRIRVRDTEKERLETEKGEKAEVEQFIPKNNVEKTIEDRNKLLTLQSENKRRNIKSGQQRPDDRGTGIKVSVPRKSRVVVKGSNRVVRGTPVKKYSVSNAIAAALEYALPKSSVDKLFVETKDAQLFHDRITKSKEGNKFSASVFVYPVEDYKKYRLFMTLDGNAGVAIDDKGTIISVFSFGTGKGRAAQMVINAIIEGGTHLDHFNTGLTKYYYGFGFIPVARVKFNEEFAPDDWNYETYKQWNNGRPDVVLMVYMGGNTNTLHERLGSFGEYEIALENAPYYKSFDEAQAAQAKYVEQFKKQPEVTPTEEKKITKASSIKPKNLRDVYKAGREIFGLTRSQALAQAIIVNTVVNKIAKNRSVKPEKVWNEIEFRKGLIETVDSGMLYQIADGIDVFNDFSVDGAGAFIDRVYSMLENNEEAKKVYRKLASKYHPDKAQGENATAIMQYLNKVNEDYLSGKNITARVQPKEYNEKPKTAEAPKVNVDKERKRKAYKEQMTPAQKFGAWVLKNTGLFSGTIKKEYDAVVNKINSDYESAVRGAKKRYNDLSEASVRAGGDKINMGQALIDREDTIRKARVKKANDLLDAQILYEEMTGNAVLYQDQNIGGTARGAIQFLEDGRAIISAMTNPNVSTPLHEIAHLYERYMPDSERKAVLKWAKHKTWTTDTSEMFARGFEKYLATGIAPTTELQKIFDRFKKWLTEIYNGITGSEIDIELNDAMTNIYGQMLGVENVKQAIKEGKPVPENVLKDYPDLQAKVETKKPEAKPTGKDANIYGTTSEFWNKLKDKLRGTDISYTKSGVEHFVSTLTNENWNLIKNQIILQIPDNLSINRAVKLAQEIYLEGGISKERLNEALEIINSKQIPDIKPTEKPKKVTVYKLTDRLDASVEDLIADYKARGMDNKLGWTEFIKDRNLTPEIDAKEFYKIWQTVSPKFLTRQSKGIDFSPTHYDSLKEMNVQNKEEGGVVYHVWEDGSTGSTPKKFINDNRFQSLTKLTSKQREEAAKAKIAEGFSNLAETIGAKKSLTGEERETAIQAITRIIEGLIELGIAKGMSLKDAVRDYLKQRNYIVDEDLLDEAIRRREKPEDDFPIGTTNAKVRTSREMRGLEAIPKEERIGNEELWKKVVDKIDNGEIFPRQVVKEIVISDDVETSAMKEAIVKHDRWRILKETKYINEEIIKKQNSQNKKGLIELFQRRVELENEMQENDLAAEKLGATWGRAGQFRQRNVEEDLSFEAIKREAKILNGGKELTIKQEQKFKELSEKYKELQKEYDKIREKERIREQQFQAEEEKKRKEAEQKLVNDIRNKVTPKSAKGVRDFDTQFKSDFKRQKLSQKENDIKERLKDRLSRLANVKFAVGEEGSSLIVEEISGVIQDMSELGIIKLEQGIDKIISKVKDYLLSINKNFDVKNLDKYKDEIKNKLGIPEIENAEYDELINKLVDKSQLGFDISVKGILKKILYNRVVAGSETIDDVVDDIYESVKDRIPNIDKRMIRDALSGYGEFRRLSKEEIDVKIRELKRQGRLDSAIEDVEDNRLPLRSGVERDKTTQETREKQARIIKEIKDRDLVPPPTQQDQETQWRNGLQAYQRRLENAIEDVKKEIDTGERKQRSKFKKYDTPELESLREELSRLREIRTAIDKETGRYAEQRESAIIKATERVIAEIEMDIDKLRRGVPIDKNVIAKRQGLFGLSKPMQEKFTSERIEELGKLKDALQQQLSELLPDAIKDKALLDKYKKQRQRRLEQLIEQQRTKDYGVKPKPYRPALDKEAIMINRDIEKLKYAIEKEKEQIRYKNMNLAERIGEGFINAWNIPKALMASIDLSAPMRQGIVMISKPKIFMKAFNGMFKYAFSEKIYEDWLFTLKTTDNYYEMISNDLYIAEPTAKLAAKEEDFMSNWLKYIDKIPLYGAVRVASERAYVGFLNKLRVDTYLNFKDKLQKQGFEAEELQNELKSYSHFINTATGRGKLKMTIGNKEVLNMEPIAALLNSAFFSPRLIASRLAMFNPAYYASMSKEARKDAIKTYFGTVGIIMGTLALSAIAFSGDDKFEIELDPRSSDFLKIRYGKIRFDLWGGHQQVARTLAQFITGKIKTGGEVKAMTGDKWYGQTRLKTLRKFFENKLSPSTALAKDLLQGGKNYEGEDITITNELINKTVPLYLKDVKEAVEEEGWEFAFIAGFPALFGVGVQTYGGKEVDVNETEETEETERVIRGGY